MDKQFREAFDHISMAIVAITILITFLYYKKDREDMYICITRIFKTRPRTGAPHED